MNKKLEDELQSICRGKDLEALKQEYIQKYAPKYGLLGAWLLWKQIENEAIKYSRNTLRR